MNQMSRTSKVLTSLLMVGLLGAVAGIGVFSAFSSTTTNPNNTFSAGSVTLADNDSNAALYSVTNKKPGDSVTSCIKVTYTGTLAADVHIYTLNTINAFGQYIDLTIQPGTQSSPSFPSCTGFVADAGGLGDHARQQDIALVAVAEQPPGGSQAPDAKVGEVVQQSCGVHEVDAR